MGGKKKKGKKSLLKSDSHTFYIETDFFNFLKPTGILTSPGCDSSEVPDRQPRSGMAYGNCGDSDWRGGNEKHPASDWKLIMSELAMVLLLILSSQGSEADEYIGHNHFFRYKVNGICLICKVLLCHFWRRTRALVSGSSSGEELWLAALPGMINQAENVSCRPSSLFFFSCIMHGKWTAHDYLYSSHLGYWDADHWPGIKKKHLKA